MVAQLFDSMFWQGFQVIVVAIPSFYQFELLVALAWEPNSEMQMSCNNFCQFCILQKTRLVLSIISIEQQQLELNFLSKGWSTREFWVTVASMGNSKKLMLQLK